MVFHFAHILQQRMLQLLFQQCVLAGHSSNGYVGYVMPTVCICSRKIAVTETDLESSETQDWTALHLTKPGYVTTAKMSAGTTARVEMLFRYISVEKDHAGVVVRILLVQLLELRCSSDTFLWKRSCQCSSQGSGSLRSAYDNPECSRNCVQCAPQRYHTIGTSQQSARILKTQLASFKFFLYEACMPAGSHLALT